ncbi:hypothetical protein LOTGIDRAFT_156700 [Lottia gigantea]|uniref:Uncharacterized protein n=1 Tax=Lottia gigantea TaxID=225164 RepID=V4AFE3_LOTGI|nr:hypothetical protein LOTGIDRAFT_156700 [Lottia gigantea]ESP02754.1 hypothetical protein LOTGIDRAFT_156700 [Lottia gigantea]
MDCFKEIEKVLSAIMKLSEMIMCIMAVLLVTITLGNGAPQWRPQGRFGKRVNPTLSLLLHGDQEKQFLNHEKPFISEDKPYIPEVTDEISVERLTSDARDNLSKFLHRLCSESGLENVPRCSWSRKTSERSSDPIRLI